MEAIAKCTSFPRGYKTPTRTGALSAADWWYCPLSLVDFVQFAENGGGTARRPPSDEA
jgi:hypothetical protein